MNQCNQQAHESQVNKACIDEFCKLQRSICDSCSQAHMDHYDQCVQIEEILKDPLRLKMLKKTDRCIQNLRKLMNRLEQLKVELEQPALSDQEIQQLSMLKDPSEFNKFINDQLTKCKQTMFIPLCTQLDEIAQNVNSMLLNFNPNLNCFSQELAGSRLKLVNPFRVKDAYPINFGENQIAIISCNQVLPNKYSINFNIVKGSGYMSGDVGIGLGNPFTIMQKNYKTQDCSQCVYMIHSSGKAQIRGQEQQCFPFKTSDTIRMSVNQLKKQLKFTNNTSHLKYKVGYNADHGPLYPCVALQLSEIEILQQI